MSLIYKTLFEVKLLHEFYLTKSTGETIFSLTSQSDRISFLFDQFNADQESIDKNIEFTFPADLEPVYNDYNLKLLSTYSGFKVATRVNQNILSDGSLVYTPFTPLPDNLAIYILLSKKNNFIDTFTNTRINSRLAALYFFSNDKIIEQPTFPFLITAVTPVRAGYDYEQGELASFGPADIAGYYQNDTGGQWNPFPGTAFSNENDRLMLPLQFHYSFPAANNVTKAQFVLNDIAGNTIKSFTINSGSKITKTSINLGDIRDLLLAPLTASFADFTFSLSVSTNDGYYNNHTIFFIDTFYNRNLWGMVGIHTKSSNAEFNLFSDEGYLIKMRDPAGVWTDAPIFEIPVKSRFAYWRYINNKGKKLQLDPASGLTNYLSQEADILVSKLPRPSAQSFLLLQEDGGSGMKYFPNPVSYDLKIDTKDRLCYDIMVPESENFPVDH